MNLKEIILMSPFIIIASNLGSMSINMLLSGNYTWGGAYLVLIGIYVWAIWHSWRLWFGAPRNEPLCVVEYTFYKDSFLNNTPTHRFYGTQEDCSIFLKKVLSKNSQYSPVLDAMDTKLSFNTGDRRNHLYQVYEMENVRVAIQEYEHLEK